MVPTPQVSTLIKFVMPVSNRWRWSMRLEHSCFGVVFQGFPFRETTTHVVWSFQMFGICGNISIWKRMGGPWWNWVWFHLGFRSFRFWIACENSPLVLLWHGISLRFNHTSSVEWWWNVDIDDNSKKLTCFFCVFWDPFPPASLGPSAQAGFSKDEVLASFQSFKNPMGWTPPKRGWALFTPPPCAWAKNVLLEILEVQVEEVKNFSQMLHVCVYVPTFTNKNQLNIGKYTSLMDPMG